LSRSLARRAALALILIGLQTAHGANEAGFYEIWKKREATPTKHDEIITLCRKFYDLNPGDPLREAAKSLEAWHLLAAGRDNEAWPIFESQANLSGNAVQTGAARVAKGWISRREMQKVAASLKLFYRQEIAFPKELAEISAHPKIPAQAHPAPNDPFGTPWKYRLVGLDNMPGFENQKYSLECAELGPLSDLQNSLKLRYADHIKIKPASISPAPGGVGSIINFQATDSKSVTVLGEGQVAKGIQLAFVGQEILVVCDATHWKVFNFRPK
jgi:hypothetical protein